MRILIFFFLLISLGSFSQKYDTVSLKGWLVYEQDYLLAFFAIKDQGKTPTYKNFLTEEKSDGERMNGNDSAPPKLLIAKKFKLALYDYNYKTNQDSLLGRRFFYIQPVKYVYRVKNLSADTTDFENGAGVWRFLINRKPTDHWAYHFPDRLGEVLFLNRTDSIFATKGGRRKSISIYPPH